MKKLRSLEEPSFRWLTARMFPFVRICRPRSPDGKMVFQSSSFWKHSHSRLTQLINGAEFAYSTIWLLIIKLILKPSLSPSAKRRICLTRNHIKKCPLLTWLKRKSLHLRLSKYNQKSTQSPHLLKPLSLSKSKRKKMRKLRWQCRFPNLQQSLFKSDQTQVTCSNQTRSLSRVRMTKAKPRGKPPCPRMPIKRPWPKSSQSCLCWSLKSFLKRSLLLMSHSCTSLRLLRELQSRHLPLKARRRSLKRSSRSSRSFNPSQKLCRSWQRFLKPLYLHSKSNKNR